MERVCIALVTGYMLGLPLGSGASAQVSHARTPTAANLLDPRTNLIAAIPDARDPELAGHLDLIEVAIYETDGNAVVVEFTTREPVPEPDEGTRFSYRLAFDGDHPYWDPDYGRSRADADFEVRMVLRTGADDYVRGGRLLEREGNRIALLGIIPEDLRGTPASVIAEVACFDNPTSCGRADFSRTELIELPSRSEHGARIDVMVVYTAGAREDAGGVDGMQAEIDLRVAETNQAFANSGVIPRLHLVWSAEVDYTEVPRDDRDSKETNTIDHLINPSDGYMDEVHVWRDRYAADLVHLIVDRRFTSCGEAKRLRDPSSPDAASRNAFTISRIFNCYSLAFAHELGHSMGLAHDRYAETYRCCDGLNRVFPYSHGYVNQRAFDQGAPASSRWRTIMAYDTQCRDAGFPRRPTDPLGDRCFRPLLFSNPDVRYNDDPAGVPGNEPSSEIAGPADARRSLNELAHVVANFRYAPPNRPPKGVGTLAPLALAVSDAAVPVDVSGAFWDPDGDRLTYDATSSAPSVASVTVFGSTVTVRAVEAGTATVTVTATDASGSNTTATQSFGVTVQNSAKLFTDHPIVPGLTPVKALHFTELQTRIDALRRALGLTPWPWTDSVLTAAVTPIRGAHLLDLRRALATAYAAAGRVAPTWTDAVLEGGRTAIRSVHIMELRRAVIALE